MYTTFYKQTNATITDYQALINGTITSKPIYKKVTIFNPHPKPPKGAFLAQISVAQNAIEGIYNTHLKPFENNYESQYREFQIPKASGGMRTIHAPNDEFKRALSKTKDIFEYSIKCLPHNAAYAYIPGRAAKDALQIHQQNHSNWYLKIDLENFFDNCSPEIVYTQLRTLYPFYYFDEQHCNLLAKIIKICSLNNGLPQGSPISPLLTNLIMVNYDFIITTQLSKHFKQKFIYTRYADDMLISSQYTFDWQDIQTYLQTLLVPFKIKTEKTRYGSRAGSNWNLGLMLNKDNNITVGWENKRTLKAALNNFVYAQKQNTPWSEEQTNELRGHLSYLKNIEPGYYNYLIQKYTKKYGNFTI